MFVDQYDSNPEFADELKVRLPVNIPPKRAMSTFISQLLSSTRGSEIVATLLKHRKLILIPTILCTLVAGWYAMKPKSWQASQSLVVRDDLIGESFKPGRFESLDSMKTAQETILHMAREPSVVRQALEAIGPPSGKDANWLDGDRGVSAVESAQDAISIVAPNGAEFGKTEVIVLQVKASSRERAGKLVTALLDKTESNLRTMRSKRLESMESELKQSLDLAEEDYMLFANELKELEHKIGPDLPTLLNMVNDSNASNDFQVALENIRTARRTAQAQLDITTKHLEILRATIDSPQQLVAAPNDLLQSQPALKRLKDGIVDLQLKFSEFSGRFRDAHPKYFEMQMALAEAKRQLFEELQVAVRGLESQHAVQSQQIQRLNDEEKEQQERLVRLTNNRADYATLASQAKKRNEEHAKTRAEYSEIKSLGQAAQTVNLMTRLEAPFISGKALGPGRTTILGSGTLGGILIGLGLVMFFSAPNVLSIIEPPTGPGENMVRPVDAPSPNSPTSNRPKSPESGPRPPATRPVHVVKQLDETPAQRPEPAVAPKATQVVPDLKFASPSSSIKQEKPSPAVPVAKPASATPVAKLPEKAKPASQIQERKIISAAPATPAIPKPPAPSKPAVPKAPSAESTALKKKRTTKVAPPRVKPDQSSSVSDTLVPGATILLPASDAPIAKTICLNELREELGAPAVKPVGSDLPRAQSLNDVKQQLMKSATKSSNESSKKESAPKPGSIQDRIKRLIDVPKGPGAS